MTTRRVSRLLKECLDGATLAPGDALLLSSVEGDEFAALLRAAAELRDRHKGRTVTFSPKVFIPLTNLCRDFCGYCTFRKAPGEEGARTMTLEEVLETVRRAAVDGLHRGAVQPGGQAGGHLSRKCGSFWGRAATAGRWSICTTPAAWCWRRPGLLPHANPGLMARADLERLRRVNASMGLMLENVSERLMEPGGPPCRRSGQETGGAAPDPGGGRPAAHPLHHRDPHRHRRDPGGAHRVAVRHPGAARALRPHPGSDRAELPREARDTHAVTSRTRITPRRPGPSPWRG